MQYCRRRYHCLTGRSGTTEKKINVLFMADTAASGGWRGQGVITGGGSGYLT
jgi:hypothetical protein